MTLVVHKILDVLRQRPNAEMQLRVLQQESEDATKKHYQALLQYLEDAEKFDFGDLHLEQVTKGKYALPPLSDAEREAWKIGLLPLPADVCWYEYVIGGCRSGLLVAHTGDDNNDTLYWSALRLDWVPGRTLHIDGIWATLKRDELDLSGDTYNIALHGNKPFRDSLNRAELKSNYGVVIPIALYLTVMLNSKTTEITRETPPEKLNKARIKNGRAPLSAHTVVRIIPAQYLRERRKESGRTRLPPRLHWRRSHLRIASHKTPKAKQLSTGEWKILIPRFLVGRASDAEVSHEYRIAQKGDTL